MQTVIRATKRAGVGLLLPCLLGVGTFGQSNPAAPLPSAPEPQAVPQVKHVRLARTVFKVSEGARWAAFGADMGTTVTFLTNGSGCTESFPWLRPTPRPRTAVLAGTGAHLVISGVQWWLYRRNRNTPDALYAQSFVNFGIAAAHGMSADFNKRCL